MVSAANEASQNNSHQFQMETSTSYNSSENQSGGTTGYGTGNSLSNNRYNGTNATSTHVAQKLAQLEIEERDLTISYYL